MIQSNWIHKEKSNQISAWEHRIRFFRVVNERIMNFFWRCLGYYVSSHRTIAIKSVKISLHSTQIKASVVTEPIFNS